ncbi:MAG: signal peptidase I [Alphaproteobacteria bacterium]|nr:signal peptidase I [Alphaproteobacteria bacterium]
MSGKHKNTVREWFDTLFYGILIAIVFRSFLIEPFNIPSGSMIPTLEVGDHIFIKKWSYGYSRYSFPFGSWGLWNGRFFKSELKVGDVIVFREPTQGKDDFVKRLIGLPGDTIQMIGGRLYINGKIVERKNPRPYVVAEVPKSLRSGYSQGNMVVKGNKLLVDRKPAEFDYTIEYKSDDYCNETVCGIKLVTEYTEVLPNGVEHKIIERSDDMEYDNTEPFVVPENKLFFMGDNRDNSNDSRYFGAVPVDNVLGRVWFTWYSHNYAVPMLAVWGWGSKMRWNRFGLGIK